VRLITRGGYNLAFRYPWIVEAARNIRQRRLVLDGEAVVIGVDGVSDFDVCTPASMIPKCSSTPSTVPDRLRRSSYDAVRAVSYWSLF
jgi:hypothetical protein